MAPRVDLDDPKVAAKAATVGAVADLAKTIGASVGGLRRQVAELAKRIEMLEASPLTYGGTFETGKTYAKGTFCTHNGSLWHANYKTARRPGESAAWTLAVRRGRNGRDAR